MSKVQVVHLGWRWRYLFTFLAILAAVFTFGVVTGNG